MGETALMTAAARAVEHRREGRILDDPYAEALAGKRGFEVLEITDPWLFSDDPLPFPRVALYVVRHRIYDDLLLEWTASGIDQVVLVGAGLDTRAYRLGWDPRVAVYEIDAPAVVQHKDDVLAGIGATATCRRVAIGVDLRDEWADRLLDAGFDPAARSVWVAEGLLFYLPEEAAARLVQDMARLAAPASRLLTQTMSPSVDAQFAARFASLGAPFAFFTDDGPGFLRENGWDAEVLEFEGIRLGDSVVPAGAGSTLVGTRRD